MPAKNLIIVESPAKAKTIEKFLGKDYVVKSSFGHIRDLPKKNMGIDIEGDTFEPEYQITTDKKKVVAELKREAKGKEVWLAADEDREGEAIAWHVCHALKLDPKKTKRIVYHEITKPALEAAVKNPGLINQDIVDAQQARRILDRLVGYELSPVLWRKIQAGLSAGRVQSVTVRIVVEREREIQKFDSKFIFKVVALFDLGDKKTLKAELSKKFKTEAEAQSFLESLIGADFQVENLETKPGKKSPAPPFTTSTLQQEASRKLGFSVKQTMMVAQRLYEAGKITYMRTDSLNLSEIARDQAKQAIVKNYGAEYSHPRVFKTKSAGAQEAHEAIRPTDMGLSQYSGGERNEQRLYDLIWKRTLASQMSEARIEKTIATISISSSEMNFVSQGEVLKFDGFLKVYLEGNDDEENEEREEAKMLPPLKEGQSLKYQEIIAKQSFSRPPSRYTEASLVKKLEEMGIGRPSTYAPTISTVQARGYIEKTGLDPKKREVISFVLKSDKIDRNTALENYGAEKNKLFPTEIGKIVTDFLVNHFEEVVDFGFTKKVEESFDAIAQGDSVWQDMIRGFYTKFHDTVVESAGISREEASQSRELGKDPKSGKPIIARLGRFGPMIQIGTKDDDEKPKFASIPEGETIDSITMEVALEQFEFPKLLGKHKSGDDISVSLGRFGPYIKCGSTNASLKRKSYGENGEEIPGDEAGTVTLQRAIELIDEKIEADKNKYIGQWPEEEVELLRGPYGIYIKSKKKGNVKIPKTVEDPEKLDLAACLEIIEKAPEKRGRFTKKSGAKKATKKKTGTKKTATKSPKKKSV